MFAQVEWIHPQCYTFEVLSCSLNSWVEERGAPGGGVGTPKTWGLVLISCLPLALPKKKHPNPIRIVKSINGREITTTIPISLIILISLLCYAFNK